MSDFGHTSDDVDEDNPRRSNTGGWRSFLGMATDSGPLLPMYNPDSGPQHPTLATRLGQGLTSLLETLLSSIQGDVDSGGHTIRSQIFTSHHDGMPAMVCSSIANEEDWTRFRGVWLEGSEERHRTEAENNTDLSNPTETRNSTGTSNQTPGVEEGTEAGGQMEAIWRNTGDPVEPSVVVGIKNDGSCLLLLRGSIGRVNGTPSVPSIRAAVVMPGTPYPILFYGGEVEGTSARTAVFAVSTALNSASNATRSGTGADLDNLRDAFDVHMSTDLGRAIHDRLSFVPRQASHESRQTTC